MYLFGDCKKLKKLYIEKIKTIPIFSLAFITGLQKLTFGNNVVKLEENAIYHCKNIKKIIFGKDVTKLEENAIYYCPKLTVVRFKTRKTIDWHPYWLGSKDMYPGCGKVKHIYMNCPKWEPKNPLADWIA